MGVPWSVRFDNCKTAVARRGGPWAILNDDYAAYARQLGFVPDACRIRGSAPRCVAEPVPRATPHLRREQNRSSTTDPDQPGCANLCVP